MAPSVNDPGPVGATATLTELVPASVSRRASLTGYTGLIIPVVGVGVASGFIGYFRAVLAFSILLAILCVFSLASIRKTALVPRQDGQRRSRAVCSGHFIWP
jgi:hypothetical protein